MDKNSIITYERVLVEKFVFTSRRVDKSFSDFIWGLDYEDTGKSEGEVRYKLLQVNKVITKKILSFLSQIPLEKYLWEHIKRFEFDINKMQLGEYVPMHNEVNQKSPFEILFWLTKTDSYLGREFVMQGENVDTTFKPKNGSVCVLDTMQPSVFHGVNPLLSNTEVITITGGLGRK